jgi:murein DD-endopeptidase MepM/ murein hydrolase activator NlpD
MENAYANFARHQTELGYTDALLPAIATYWDNQGHARMNYTELKRWCDEAQTRQPAFVSLYRAGVAASDAWRAFAELITVRVGGIGSTVSPVDETLVGRKVSTATQVLVYPGGPGYSEGFYPPAQPGTGWTEFVDASSHPTRYRRTVTDQTMYASYVPSLTGKDRYVIEVFVPGIHATTREAQYFVTVYEGGDRIEKRVTVDQRTVSNVWVSLGVYDLDPLQAETGRVNLVDVTSDSTPREIAFSAIRWTPIGSISAFGFDPPIGSAEERAGSAVWPGQWKDANPYKSKYNLGYHTGADLNLNWPTWNLDKGAPVYACADGVVTFSAETGGSWQALVVIEHTMPDNSKVYSRYGHVDNRIVSQGDRVVRGQQIAQVGQSGGQGGNFHLHFDISTTGVLKLNPQNWPGFDFQALLRDYVEPKTFILAHRPGVR